MASKTIRRGDIWFARLDPTVGGEIRKRRPVVIVSNDAGNRASGLVTVVPLTSNIERIYPFEVLLKTAATGLGRDSKACAQQIRTLSKIRLDEKRTGTVSPDEMRALDSALRLHLALD
jgi:mRNA interferase MazF